MPEFLASVVELNPNDHLDTVKISTGSFGPYTIEIFQDVHNRDMIIKVAGHVLRLDLSGLVKNIVAKTVADEWKKDCPHGPT